MRGLKKWTALMAVAVLLAATLAGCGSGKSGSGTPAPAAKQPVSLTVWSHMTQPEVDEINKVAQQWAQKTGNKVTVQMDNGDMSAFPTVAATGKGPDIMFGLAHDNLGGSYKANLLAPVPDGIINRADFVPASLDATSFDGKLYGIPVSMETYALFYRTDKIQTAPKTWDEFIADAQKYGFMYDVTNFYFSYGFIQGEGGYVFKNNGGALDPNDIGLDNAGAIKGFQIIDDFIHKYKFMKPDITGDIAKGNFIKGTTALYISGPWDVADMQKAKVPFAVVPMPTLPDGQKFRSFEGVYASFVNALSKHQTEAWDLEKYLVENTPAPLFKVGKRFPVQTKYVNSPDVTGDAITSGFGQAALDATPMPNIAAMGQVWNPMKDALTLIVQGKQKPEVAAPAAVKNLKTLIQQSK